MNIYIKLIYIFLLSQFTSVLSAQITLDNPSFEGTPADATIPAGWFAATEGTTPDILPGYWGVYEDPEDGESYVGLITRPDGSFESIEQRLKSKLETDVCYTLSLDISHSDTYTGYNKPVHLRMWIADTKSDRQQLIFTSPLITEEEWSHFQIDFTPEKDAYYIIIEAFISDDKISHKGNILIDNLSHIYVCNKA